MTGSRIVVPFLLFVISLMILGLSFNIKDSSVLIPSSASFFPAMIAVILLICSLLIWRKNNNSIPPQNQTDDADHNTFISIKDQLKRLVPFLCTLILFAILMNYIHFLLLSTIYLFTVMSMLNKTRWIMNILTSVISASLIYFLFVNVFEIVFPS